jgi:hypothetical protein
LERTHSNDRRDPLSELGEVAEVREALIPYLHFTVI